MKFQNVTEMLEETVFGAKKRRNRAWKKPLFQKRSLLRSKRSGLHRPS